MTEVTLVSATLGEDGKIEPPLGPLYVAAALERVGCTVDFRDYQLADGAGPFSPSHFARFMEGHTRFLLISCFVDMLPVVILACKLIKASRPDSFILLGGPGPSAGAEKILHSFPWLDAIVRGEGEETIQDWVELLTNRRARFPAPINGMVYRHRGTLVDGGSRPRIRDIDRLGLPAYHLLSWNRYDSARVITTRGCPYRCSFCDVAPLWNRKAVYRDVDRTIDEMFYLRDEHGATGIAVVDDTFVLDRKRVLSFCRRLISRGANLGWGCFGRVNLMSEDLIELMAAAGCSTIFYGIDSGAQSILDATEKKQQASTILPTLEISARHFDRIEASFIWGYPTESLDEFLMTMEIAGEASKLAPRLNIQIHMLSPLPSSPIYTEYKNELVPPDPKDSHWLLLPQVLIDDRASVVRPVVEDAQDIFPGFFTFPTPEKEKKREYLIRSMTALDYTVGLTVIDPAVSGLLSRENQETEAMLLNEASDSIDRIGVGLALGFFRRTRRAHNSPKTGDTIQNPTDPRGQSLSMPRVDPDV